MANTWLFGATLPAPVTIQKQYDALIVQPSCAWPVANATTQAGISTQTLLIAALSAYVATIGTGKVVLFTNVMQVTSLTEFVDITEPTASWYSETASPLGAPYLDAQGNINFSAPSVEFSYSGENPPTVVQGWGYVNVPAS